MAKWQDDITKEINIWFGLESYLRIRHLFESHKYYDKSVDLINYPFMNDGTPYDEESYWLGDFCVLGLRQSDKYTVEFMKDFAGIVSHAQAIDRLHVMLLEKINKNEIVASYRWVKSFIDYFENAMLEISQSNDDPRYAEWINYMAYFIKISLWGVNDEVRELYEISNTNTDKLEFTLSPEQLAALLYLIRDAGFIRKKDSEGTFTSKEFYTFCHKYFYCRKKGAKDFTPVTNLQRKIWDVEKHKSPNALGKVYQDLDEAYGRAI